jgi:hypothetical protein
MVDLAEDETLLGVRTTAVVKKLGCSILKSLIEQDKLLIQDEDVIKELLIFCCINGILCCR